MSFDPQESSEARAEIGKRNHVAALNPQPSASSPAPGMRDPQLVTSRGVVTSQQPFPLGDVVGTPVRPRRHVDPIPARDLQASPPPSGREARFLIMGTVLALIVVGTIAYLQSIGVIQ